MSTAKWQNIAGSKKFFKFQEEKIAPKPYVYEYGGVDASGLAAAKTESQDADGTVHGKNNQKIHSYNTIFKKIYSHWSRLLTSQILNSESTIFFM